MERFDFSVRQAREMLRYVKRRSNSDREHFCDRCQIVDCMNRDIASLDDESKGFMVSPPQRCLIAHDEAGKWRWQVENSDGWVALVTRKQTLPSDELPRKILGFRVPLR